MQRRLVEKLHGYSAHDANFKTHRHTRGLFGYPLNLYQTRGDASTELDYEQWCAALAKAGVNLLRVRLTGRQQAWGTNNRACGFEPPPHGTFNPWLIVLDPSRMPQYRGQQLSGP